MRRQPTTSMRLTRVLALVLCAAWPNTVGAQREATVELPVEAIGLKRWTVQMLRDSFAARVPGKTLGSAGCAAILRDTFHFAAASVVESQPPGLERRITIVAVEPQDSARVRYRRTPLHQEQRPHEWRRALGILDSTPAAVVRFVQDSAALFGGADAAADTPSPDERFRQFVRLHASEADRRLAVRTLAKDGTRAHRIIAVALLSNFLTADSTWWVLADEMRDRAGIPAAMAAQLMLTRSRVAPRAVDWRPAAPALRALLDGTNVHLFTATLELLRNTSIDPALAPTLLRRGGELPVAFLGASDPYDRDLAHDFLVRVSGQDFGYDRTRWSGWIDGL